MKEPNTIAEIEAWLSPLAYEEFWEAIAPHCPDAARRYRAECDDAVQAGIFTLDEALQIYKFWYIEAFACAIDPDYDVTRRGIYTVSDAQLLGRH